MAMDYVTDHIWPTHSTRSFGGIVVIPRQRKIRAKSAWSKVDIGPFYADVVGEASLA